METTRYYQPYFLEDTSGRLTGSQFIDIHDRIKFSYRCSWRDLSGSRYEIIEVSSPYTSPVAVLEYGPDGALGSVEFGATTLSMAEYLVKIVLADNGRSEWRFTAQDGRPYRWSHQTHEDHEWTCVDNEGNVVAFYHLKIAGEPPYPESSGCMLTVEEMYGSSAFEFLASCLIVRHIRDHGLS